MNSKSVMSVISVWMANGVGWLLALSTGQWTEGLMMVKEIVGLISILLAIAYTLYKFMQGWVGWTPWNKKKKG